jgi:hypothetical protein
LNGAEIQAIVDRVGKELWPQISDGVVSAEDIELTGVLATMQVRPDGTVSDMIERELERVLWGDDARTLALGAGRLRHAAQLLDQSLDSITALLLRGPFLREGRMRAKPYPNNARLTKH